MHKGPDRQAIWRNDSFYINERKNAFLQLPASRKKCPVAFALLMMMVRSFFATHSCTWGIAWIYSCNEPEHRWVNDSRGTGIASATLEGEVRKRRHSLERPLWSWEPHFALNQIWLSPTVVCKSNPKIKGKVFSNTFTLGIIFRAWFHLPCSLEQSVGSRIPEVFNAFHGSM